MGSDNDQTASGAGADAFRHRLIVRLRFLSAFPALRTILLSAFAIFLTTALLWLLQNNLARTRGGGTDVRSLDVLYVLPIALSASIWGRRAGFGSVALSVACYCCFLAPPTHPLLWWPVLEGAALALVGGAVTLSLDTLRGERAFVKASAARLSTYTEQLEEKDQRLRLIMSSAPCLIWGAEVRDTGGELLNWQYRYLDEAAAHRFLPLDTSGSTSYADAAYSHRHPDDRSRLDAYSAAMIRQGQGYTQEFRCRGSDGQWHWLREDVHVEPLEPRRWRVVGVATDITELKRAEEALAESRERLNGILSSLDDVVWSISATTFELVYINPAAERIYGYSPGQFFADPRLWQDRVHPDDEDRVAWSQADLLERGVAIREFRIVRPDGQIRWLRDRAVQARDEKGVAMRIDGISTDITEQKLLQQQLIQSEKLAAVGLLVAGVAHEINNPLAVIYSSAQLLEMHRDPEVKEDARVIRQMAQRTSRIVRSLLTFARGGDGSRRSLRTLKDLIDNTLAVCGYILRTEGVIIENFYDESAPPAFVDENQIQQVLLNLFTNAVHALRANPYSDRRIFVTTGRTATGGASDFARVTITDNGCGMSPEVQRRIFEPFFTTKDIGEGTGLGLAVCHGIVQAHGGRLTVESMVGKGTTFSLDLPTAK